MRSPTWLPGDKAMKLLLSIPVFLILTGCASEAPVERLMQSSVHIDILGVDASGKQVVLNLRMGDRVMRRTMGGSGTGFIIGDGRYIVTNYHVCCDIESMARYYLTDDKYVETGVERIALLVGVSGSKETVPARTIWSSARKDLSVLELEKPIRGPAVALLPSKNVKVGQKAWIVGYPGQNTIDTDAQSDLVPKPYPGDIVAKVRMDNNPRRQLWRDIDMIQTNSITGPGASGSPVFDLCGRVFAIHARGQGGDKQGVKYEVASEELLPELDRLNVKYATAWSGCSDKNQVMVAGATVGGGGLALAAVLIATTRRGRDMVRRVTSRRRDLALPLPPPPPMPRPPGAAILKPVLKGVAGYYAGNALEMGPEAFAIGRDSKAANLVFPPNTDSVSRRHCTIRYDGGKKKFLLEDCGSTNGTFLKSGEKIEPGRTHELSTGDQFYLGNVENMFEVRLEIQS